MDVARTCIKGEREGGGGMQRGERRTIFGITNHIGLSSTMKGKQGWTLQGPALRGRGKGGRVEWEGGNDIWQTGMDVARTCKKGEK